MIYDLLFKKYDLKSALISINLRLLIFSFREISDKNEK